MSGDLNVMAGGGMDLAAEAVIWDSLVASEKAQQAALRQRLRKVKVPLRHRLQARWLSFRWRLALLICPEIEGWLENA